MEIITMATATKLQYKEIGLVSSSCISFTNTTEVVKKLKVEASKLNADAIIIINFNTSDRTMLAAFGMAIKYIN